LFHGAACAFAFRRTPKRPRKNVIQRKKREKTGKIQKKVLTRREKRDIMVKLSPDKGWNGGTGGCITALRPAGVL
jgi:hypothetical protein